MRAAELKDKSVDDLKTELDGLLREQFNLRMQHSTGQLTHSHKLREVRRNVARVRTVLTQRQAEQAGKSA